MMEKALSSLGHRYGYRRYGLATLILEHVSINFKMFDADFSFCVSGMQLAFMTYT